MKNSDIRNIDMTDEFELGSHHKPRKIDKKKHHHRGFNEDTQEQRKSRISFKKYIQSLEEQLLDDELDENLK